LLDLESLVMQRIDEYVARAPALHAADMSNRKTYEANHNDVPVEPICSPFATGEWTWSSVLMGLNQKCLLAQPSIPA